MEAGSESRDHVIAAIAEVAVEREGAIEPEAVDELEAGTIGETERLNRKSGMKLLE